MTTAMPSTETVSNEIIAGLVRVHMANVADMVVDPDGDCPRCRNAVGTWLCERCGRDVRGQSDACPAVPPEKRWRFNYAPLPPTPGVQEDGR